MELSKEAREAYIDKPVCCPFCESRYIEAHGVEVDGAWGNSFVECYDCGRAWTDIYKLVDMEVVDSGHS